LNPDESSVTFNDALYTTLVLASRDSAAINIDTTIPPQNGLVTEILKDFKIKAIANGGATVFKEV